MFAAKNTDTCLYRLKENGNTAKFPDAPSKMFVYNGDLDKLDIKEFREIIDIDYYEALVNKNWEIGPTQKLYILMKLKTLIITKKGR